MRRTAAVAALGALLLLAGCNDGATGQHSAATTAKAAPVPPAQLSVSPTAGAADVSPVVPLQVSVTGGEVTNVALVDGGGQPIAGSPATTPEDDATPTSDAAATSAIPSGSSSASRSSSAPSSSSAAGQPKTVVWKPDNPLQYGATYTLTATAQNKEKKEVTATSTFTTVKPQRLVGAPDVGPLDGAVVGVGLPIRVYFDRSVTNRAAVESNLKVTTSNPIDGAWRWVNSREVHFRPSAYWPPNTDVRLDANLYGVDFGGGAWGKENRTVSFKIGAKHVSVADAGTHTMQVFDGDQLVQTFPISAGSTKNPTRNGPHVVTQISRSVIMDSSTFGLAVDAPGGYRTNVDYAVRISNNGEFVHSAPWSVGDQGRRNVSHGCINLSPARAQWFYGFAQPGDVVEVKNSIGPMLSAVDGDIYDWAIPWDQWKAGSALN